MKKIHNLHNLFAIVIFALLLTPLAYPQQSGGGNYPAGGGVRVKETDGSPNVPGTQTIVFPNGSLTRAGQTVTVAFGGAFTSAVTITSTANPCFAVGPNGATNPTLAVNCSVASQVTGVLVTGAAAGGGVTVGVTSSGSNENLILAAKGTASVNLSNAGTAAAPAITLSADSTTGWYRNSANQWTWSSGGNPVLSLIGTQIRMASGFALTFTGTDSVSAADVGILRSASGVLRTTNASTGAGQLLIGTSTDTADAQLSVYSQSTTRPGLKLRALSGTAGSQNVFESYNASGTLTTYIRADGLINTSGTQIGSTATNGFYWNSSTGVVLSAGVPYSWASGDAGATSADLKLERDAANTLAQRNSTNAQTFRLYNTYTDASNYERLSIAGGSDFTLSAEAAGTGLSRSLRLAGGTTSKVLLQTGGLDRWEVNSSGHLLAVADNTYDIGASGATRPRTVYAGSGVVTPSLSFGINGSINATAGDGIFTLYNAAGTSFSRLQFGGTTSSFPSLKRSSAALEVKLADDSAYAAHRALTYGVNNACVIRSGSGSPESAVTGNVCDLYLRTDGGANTTLYIKESGTGNTGWIAK